MKKKAKSKAKKSSQQHPQAKTAKAALQAEAKQQNPYDVFQNKRRRLNVLGEKVKGAKRNLVKARAVASGERVRILLAETLQDRRTSKFKDARPGEGMPASLPEEGGLDILKAQRFAKLRQKQAKKTFSLGNASMDEVTVGGKPLSQLADKDLQHKEEEDDYYEGAEFEGLPRDEAMRQQQLAKIEAAKERKEREEQLSKLDNEFRSVRSTLQFRPTARSLKSLLAAAENQDGSVPASAAVPPPPAVETKQEPADGYDLLLKEMMRETRVVASERLKTPEEIAREKAEKLEALERDRVARATGASAEQSFADSSVVADAGDQRQQEMDEAEADDDEEEEGSGDDEGEEEEDGSAAADAEEAEEDNGDDDAAAADDDEDDKQGLGWQKLLSVKEAGSLEVSKNASEEADLPFAIDCPGNVRELTSRLDCPPSTAFKVVQRIRAYNAPELSGGNREKLERLLVLLLEYLLSAVARSDGDISSRGLQQLYALRLPLVELASEYTEQAFLFFSTRLEAIDTATVPRAAQLALLKLISLVYPVSDFQHPVVAPAAVLADHWASKLAAFGDKLEDLISDAIMLWEVLYSYTAAVGKFSPSFFLLGSAILSSCEKSAKAGRSECTSAAEACVELSAQAIRKLVQADPAAATVAAREFMQPMLAKGFVSGKLEGLKKEMEEISSRPLEPLTLFEAAPPQIRTLEPIFHDSGDRRSKYAEQSESKRLKNKLNEERRAAGRQIRRDAMALQQLSGRKESLRRVAKEGERKRVRTIMEQEKDVIHKMVTEGGNSMDTSLHRYRASKEQKKANRRLSGNATAENPGKQKEAKGAAPSPKGSAAEKASAPASSGKKVKKKGKGKS